jgi:hypothetical protein
MGVGHHSMPEGQGKKGTCERCGQQDFVSPWWESESKMIWLCQRCQNYVLMQQQATQRGEQKAAI